VSPHGILADLTAEIGAGGDHDPRVRITLDVPADLRIEADAAIVRRLLAPLLCRGVDAALRRRPAGRSQREVIVTGVRYPDRIEIEFADSGADLTPREWNSVPRPGTVATPPRESTDPILDDVVRLAVSLGGSVSALNCPEGGSAVTLHLPIRHAALRRAA
jgi:hypothetical protein